MLPSFLPVLAAAVALAVLPGSALAHPGHMHHAGMPGVTSPFTVPFPAMGPSAGGYSSDNVEFVKNLREVGDGVGATVVGNTMFVTSTTHLTIYDVTDAENPVRTGVFTLNIEFENEEVPTNGKILGISNEAGCVPAHAATAEASA